MNRAFGYYSWVMGGIAKLILAVSAIIIGIDVFLIFFEAIGRYVTGTSRALTEEIPRLPMMGVLYREGRHISMEVLHEKLSGKLLSYLKLLVHMVVMGSAIQFFIAGSVAVEYFRQMGFATRTELVFAVWITYLPFPVGFGLFFLFSLEMAWKEALNLYSAFGERGQ
jgi:TRAP-type C4-dicarboxylate transport system permease small subunit